MHTIVESTSKSHVQQLAYDAHTGGAIFNAAGFGFMPVFKDIHTNETHLSSYKNGEPSAVHILDGLPDYWVAEWGQDGRATALMPGVIAGFMRSGRFYTLNEIISDLCDA